MTDSLVGIFLGRDVDWMRDASCAGVGGDWWFPEKGEAAKGAKAVCRGCPVRAECLEYSLTCGQTFGVWGGVSERDRRVISRELGLDVEDAA